MKTRIKSLILSIVFGIGLSAQADEGMWLPFLINELNYPDMQKLGLKLTSEQLYDINKASLKDAIVMLDFGSCTGEIISNEGLMLTNHHCGYGEIQAHSTTDHDYLTDGFVAWEKSEELANPGKTASFLNRIEDVTDRVLANVTDNMTEDERYETIEKEIEKIIVEATNDSFFNASVESMFEGNEYYLFVYTTYRDVRLVFAPPSSIGNYGGDTDNWMWPRHTGDFSIFRIYTTPNGEPVDYAEENIPLKPKHFLPISLDGVKENDFAMVWGYPASTDRYLSSFGVKLAIDEYNNDMISIMGSLLEVMKQDMDKSDEVRIKYASKYARIANFWKYLQGQSRGLKSLKIYDKKVAIETDFNNWVSQDPVRKEKYGMVINDLESAYKSYTENAYKTTSIYFRFIAMQAEIFRLARNSMSLQKKLKDGEDITEAVNRIEASLDAHFKDYYMQTDMKKMVEVFEGYYKNIPKQYQPDIMNLIVKKYKGDFNKYVEYVYSKSIFSTRDKIEAFLEKPSSKILDKDPALAAYKSFNNAFQQMNTKKSEVDVKLNKAERLFIAGLREMNPEKKYYPNANRTMRVSYGIVDDYYPADAVHFDYKTYLKGVMEKEDPENEDFIVPEKLKEIYLDKDYGRYGIEDKLPVCFLTNNDITGGNSGSPVINGKGELIGAAFDGNWEAMSGDIAFEPELQRTIVVDIRYVLLVIDKFSGANHLIEELNIVEKNQEIQEKVETMEVN